jgi:hypothetical protein
MGQKDTGSRIRIRNTAFNQVVLQDSYQLKSEIFKFLLEFVTEYLSSGCCLPPQPGLLLIELSGMCEFLVDVDLHGDADALFPPWGSRAFLTFPQLPNSHFCRSWVYRLKLSRASTLF